MKCPKCGAENAEGLQFCKRCWTSFRPASGPLRDERPPDERDATRGPLFGVPYASDAPGFGARPPWSSRPERAELERIDRRPDGVRPPSDAGPSPRSVLSMILGLLSVVLFCTLWITVPLDLVGFVLGLSELREINRGAAPVAGRGFATAGVILSGCALAVKIFIFLMIPHG